MSSTAQQGTVCGPIEGRFAENRAVTVTVPNPTAPALRDFTLAGAGALLWEAPPLPLQGGTPRLP